MYTNHRKQQRKAIRAHTNTRKRGGVTHRGTTLMTLALQTLHSLPFHTGGFPTETLNQATSCTLQKKTNTKRPARKKADLAMELHTTLGK